MTRSGERRTLEWRDPLDAFAALADDDHALLLHDGLSGRSIVFAFPDRVFDGDGREAFDWAARHWREARPGRMAGLFSYELAGAFERIPAAPADWPDLALAAYPAWAHFDRAAQSVAIEADDAASANRLARALNQTAPDLASGAAEDWAPAWTRDAYETAASKARDYVHAGDVFQVNLSQRFTARLPAGSHPYAVFRRLAQTSPASHAAYMRLDAERCVITNSPERFIRLDADGRVMSEPIKGTRPRGATAQEDARLAAELSASEKDRAENLMIVDLMRHDLSRVCRPGSIAAPRLCEPRAYANVHHLVSTVTGRLADGMDAFDLIGASFPPGSITGAPKVRAMEIIAELEGEARGPYCGAMGWIGADGAMDLNVMIRTASLVRSAAGGWTVVVRSGGGIVADSEPAAEYDETLAKASALKRALEQTA